MTSIRACVFDAYGTLLDVNSAVARHAAAIGPQADELSALWRQRQLEYSWTRSLIGRYADFAALTAEALDFALARLMPDARAALRSDLLQAYSSLDAYSEVPQVLAELRAAGFTLAVLSNGAPGMLADGLAASGIAALIDRCISVDAIGVYKPDPRVYQLACDELGLTREAVTFQSSNPWDVAGAGAFGFQTVWVNRLAQPREYGFAPPTHELPDLSGLPATLAAHRAGARPRNRPEPG